MTTTTTTTTTAAQRPRPSTLSEICLDHSKLAAPLPATRAPTTFTIPATGAATTIDHLLNLSQEQQAELARLSHDATRRISTDSGAVPPPAGPPVQAGTGAGTARAVGQPQGVTGQHPPWATLNLQAAQDELRKAEAAAGTGQDLYTDLSLAMGDSEAKQAGGATGPPAQSYRQGARPRQGQSRSQSGSRSRGSSAGAGHLNCDDRAARRNPPQPEACAEEFEHAVQTGIDCRMEEHELRLAAQRRAIADEDQQMIHQRELEWEHAARIRQHLEGQLAILNQHLGGITLEHGPGPTMTKGRTNRRVD